MLALSDKLRPFWICIRLLFYSEHLSYCADPKGQLYELMPLPFSEEAVNHVAQRVKHVQDILERPLALEMSLTMLARKQN